MHPQRFVIGDAVLVRALVEAHYNEQSQRVIDRTELPKPKSFQVQTFEAHMSNCACVYVDVDDPPDFFLSQQVRARKQHKCAECGRSIGRGEEYERVSGKWDGRMDTFTTCLDCVSIRDQFFCDGFCYTNLLEDLGEHLFSVGGHVDSACLAVLSPRARDMVCDMIENVWEFIDA